MELRTRRSQTEVREVAAQEEGSESRKRRRSKRRENTVDVKHMERKLRRCTIEGGLTDSSSSNEYKPEGEEDEGSDVEISLESESNVDGDVLDTVGSGRHSMCDTPEGRCEGGETKKWSCRHGRHRRGGMGSSGVHVDDSLPCNEVGSGRSVGHKQKGWHNCWKVAEDSDVVVRSRCTLKKLVAVNARMTPTQRTAVEGTVLRPCLEYCDIAMERHLTVALIKCWVPRWKAFRIGGRRVPFSVFDVALLTGLPATGRRVEFEGEEVSSEVGSLIRGRMAEREQQHMVRRVAGRSGKKRRFFRNYVSVMAELCNEITDEDRIGVWLQMYAFMILSGVLFPRTPYGAAWSLLHYVEDMNAMSEYAWAEAVWRALVETIEATQKKLSEGPLSEVQLNGFCVLIQVMMV